MKNPFLIYSILVSILILVLISKAFGSGKEEKEPLKNKLSDLKEVLKKRSD